MSCVRNGSNIQLHVVLKLNFKKKLLQQQTDSEITQGSISHKFLEQQKIVTFSDIDFTNQIVSSILY